jgi:23S rRNA pseudouridine1911/1915/1917 synthase
MLIVNKPAGLVVHPAPGHASGTLVNALLWHCRTETGASTLSGIGGIQRPGIVHRLDKDTSGLILLAKNDNALLWLQEQFRIRKVEKTYIALVDGRPPTPSGRVEASIGRDSTHRKKMAILRDGKGREAVSEYKTLEQFSNHTLLEFHPLTGRTHQIRLHCALLGCPIAGDEVYGRKKPSINIGRHFLHAKKLKIIPPNDDLPREFEAPLPEELEHVLEELRKQ